MNRRVVPGTYWNPNRFTIARTLGCSPPARAGTLVTRRRVRSTHVPRYGASSAKAPPQSVTIVLPWNRNGIGQATRVPTTSSLRSLTTTNSRGGRCVTKGFDSNCQFQCRSIRRVDHSPNWRCHSAIMPERCRGSYGTMTDCTPNRPSTDPPSPSASSPSGTPRSSAFRVAIDIRGVPDSHPMPHCADARPLQSDFRDKASRHAPLLPT